MDVTDTPPAPTPHRHLPDAQPAEHHVDPLDCVPMAIRSLEARIVALEQRADRTALKRLTENAGAMALFLGLILTFASLYEVFVSKPEADRAARVSQFNSAVNSAAQIRQEITQFQMQSTNPAVALAVASAAMPRILNNIATARVLLRSMTDEDVGVPQLIVLITESFTAGDVPSAQEFVRRAVARRNDPPYLRSEAKRYEGKLLFAGGRVDQGREALREAVALIGASDAAAASRAFTLSDWIVLEFVYGDCARAAATLSEHAPALRAPSIPLDARRQLQGGLIAQLEQLRGGRCPIPADLSAQIAGIDPSDASATDGTRPPS